MVSNKKTNKSSKVTVKGKTLSNAASSSPFGQPSNKKQSSRKSKSSWRKNIDLTSTEASLESGRISERIGIPSISSTNGKEKDLFIEDRKGDSNKANRELLNGKRIKKPLKSLEILSSRSSIPAFSNRVGVDSLNKKITVNSVNDKLKKSGMSKKMRDRLIRLSGKNVKGPFGAIVEGEKQTEDLKDRLKEIEKAEFDPWKMEEDLKQFTKEGKGKEVEREWIDDVRNRKVKIPRTLSDPQSHQNDQTKIARTLPSIPLPHSGQSYNPTQDSHSELLSSAYKIALKREAEELKGKNYKKEFDEGREMALKENLIEEEITDDDEDDGNGEGNGIGDEKETEKEKKIRRRIMGMNVDEPEDEENDDVDEGEEIESQEEVDEGLGIGEKKIKVQKRKTRSQKLKAQRVKKEEQARLALKAAKKSAQVLSSLPSTKKALLKKERQHQASLEAIRIKKEEQAKLKGLEGHRHGKFRVSDRVGDSQYEVQTEEELSENLRGLKPEGNLFRDRFQRLQARGLAEARVPVIPRRKNRGLKEYETHAYRRFV